MPTKLYRFFSLVNTLAKMELKEEASRFVLRYFWWILEPVILIAIYYLVFEYFLRIGAEEFILFLFVGKIPFLWFTKTVLVASGSIAGNKGLINNIDMPKTLFVYVSVHEALYKQWVVFLVMFGVAVFNGRWPGLNWGWLIPLLAVEYGLILFFSMFSALCVSFVPDIRMLIQMGMIFLMFTSGIFWDVENLPPALRDLVLTWNPLAFIVDAFRQVLIHESVYDRFQLLELAALVIVGLLLIHLLMHKMSRTIAAKVVEA